MENTKKNNLKSMLVPTTFLFWVTFLPVPEWWCCNAGLGQFPALCPPDWFLLFHLFSFMQPKFIMSLMTRQTYPSKIFKKTQNSKTREKHTLNFLRNLKMGPSVVRSCFPEKNTKTWKKKENQENTQTNDLKLIKINTK